MALIQCPECGNSISDKASICIHCGFPMANIKHKEEVKPEKTKFYCIYFTNDKVSLFCTHCVRPVEYEINDFKITSDECIIPTNDISCKNCNRISNAGVPIYTEKGEKNLKLNSGIIDYSTDGGFTFQGKSVTGTIILDCTNCHSSIGLEENCFSEISTDYVIAKRVICPVCQKGVSPRTKISKNNLPTCPRCGSTSITTGARGVSGFWGFIGASKTVNRCANCGHTWTPKG